MVVEQKRQPWRYLPASRGDIGGTRFQGAGGTKTTNSVGRFRMTKAAVITLMYYLCVMIMVFGVGVVFGLG